MTSFLRRNRTAVFGTAAALLVLLLSWGLTPVRVMRISYQKTGETILTHTVSPVF